MDVYAERLPSGLYRRLPDGTFSIEGRVYPKVVARFRDDHYFLSNMYPYITPIAENVYQASKFDNPKHIRRILECGSGFDAKRLSRTLKPLRKGWQKDRIATMTDIVNAKFMNNPDLANQLIGLRRTYLVEGNRHRDQFWGQDITTDEIGKNHLGRILMRLKVKLIIRSSLKPDIKVLRDARGSLSDKALEAEFDLPIEAMKHWLMKDYLERA